MTPDKKARLESVQGYVMLIRKPNDPVWYGPCENSFSLSTEPFKTFMFWSTLPEDGWKPPIDGLEWLRKDLATWKTTHPDWTYLIYDARDAEKLPVVLDWETWMWAHEPDEGTLCGVRHKYLARNLKFKLKDETKEMRIQTMFDF